MAGILGKLKGIIASASEPSRNGRRYTENFWDSIFDSDLFKEGIKNKVMMGELWHPDDEKEYGQIHPGDKSAIVLTDVEKRNLDYWGTFEILPTRAGEVLKNLIDVGCVFGVSSRGYNDLDSTLFDDPSTFELITFDIVAFPGIKSARLHPVEAIAESYSHSLRKNKVKIMENLNKLSSESEVLHQYIDDTLKIKEDFDANIQSDELSELNNYELSQDLLNYAIVIKTNDKSLPIYNDGIHGDLVVYNSQNLELSPNTEYLVDDIYYDSITNTYHAIGDWLSLS